MTAATTEDRAREDRRRWMALYVLCAGVLMTVIDATIVNVALPAIQGRSERQTSMRIRAG